MSKALLNKLHAALMRSFPEATAISCHVSRSTGFPDSNGIGSYDITRADVAVHLKGLCWIADTNLPTPDDPCELLVTKIKDKINEATS